MPLCINCAQAVPYLYTVYHSVNNVRLEQCVRVHLLLHPPHLTSPLTVIHSRSLHAAHPRIPTSSTTPSSSYWTSSSSNAASTGTCSSIAGLRPGKWRRPCADTTSCANRAQRRNARRTMLGKECARIPPSSHAAAHLVLFFFCPLLFPQTRRWLILRVGAGVVLVDSCTYALSIQSRF